LAILVHNYNLINIHSLCFFRTLEKFCPFLHGGCSVFYHTSPQLAAKMICAIGFAIVGVLAVLVVASMAKAKKPKLGCCHLLKSRNTRSSQQSQQTRVAHTARKKKLTSILRCRIVHHALLRTVNPRAWHTKVCGAM
jgi:hypothetical protein